MYAKSLLIPIAAFALSATGVSAFNPDVLQRAGLTEDQISAFEDARGLKEEGKLDKARDVLKNAGIDLKTIESMKTVLHNEREKMRTAIGVAVKANDFDVFKVAVAHSPLLDIITTKEDFALFTQAYEAHLQGHKAEVDTLLEELGFTSIHKQHAFKNASPRI